MTSPFAVLVWILLLSSCLLANGSIRVAVDVDNSTGEKESVFSYRVVNEKNEILFSGGDLAVFLDGKWCVAPTKKVPTKKAPTQSNPVGGQNASLPLRFENMETFHGIFDGLGTYDGIRIRWSCDLPSSSEGNGHGEPKDNISRHVPIITSFLNFESKRAILFDVNYPNGAYNTSLVSYGYSEGDIATLATFPSFVTNESSSAATNNDNGSGSSFFPPIFPSALSWEGSFVQSVRRLSVGPRGGPTVFYNAFDPSLDKVLVVSPFWDPLSDRHPRNPYHHFNQFTAGNNKDWSGTISSFSPGRSGRLTRIPEQSGQSILLYEGSKGGITSTLHEWGSMMQTVRNVTIFPSNMVSNRSSSQIISSATIDSKRKIRDVTLEKIGYQTDNGAMYCFCSQTNCSKILLDEKAYLDSIGIPIGYLSFQGAGVSSGRGKAAPWCVDTWSADGGQNPNTYPLDTKAFQTALGVPLQLYAPYFCPNSTKYFRPNTNFTSVTSNTNLPGCSDFSFETASAESSLAFFEWFLNIGIRNGGMTSFETDFMDQNVNCVDSFVEDPINGADKFLAGMAKSALDLNVPIQWCYASPNVVMASLELPAVTNFRVSFDFCYGGSYEIGESSLLVWALGSAPSKDTLWTTNNNRTETPGCKWTEDHENIALELHVVLAIMSTGPVGISDAIGMTNATLLKRIISKDGSLLQPSKPITAVDSSFLDPAFAPEGFLYGTHGLQLSWIFVSFKLAQAFPVTLRDFWPPLEPKLGSSITNPLVYRTFASSRDCIDGADAVSSGCVTLLSLDDDNQTIFVAPASPSDDIPGSELSPSVVTVWRDCHGVFFLGELDKYVALSPKRFSSVECLEQGVSVEIRGSQEEVVEITFLVPDSRNSTAYRVVKDSVMIRDSVELYRLDNRPNTTLTESGQSKKEKVTNAQRIS